MAKTKIPGEYLQNSVVRFTAKAGENITKGQAVYISGVSGEVPVVSLADADDTNKMPAFGLAESTVSTNASVEITSNGTLAGIDTSSYALGDILYISTTAGSVTNDPSGLEASKVQNIGMVQRVHASNGSIKVGGAGRTNATPNLNDGNIFVGNSSNKSVADSFTDVLNDQAGINSSANATAITIDSSEQVGIGTSSPVGKLHVEGATSGANLLIDDGTGFGIYVASQNAFNFNYGDNATSTGYMNFRGYQDGATQFRNLNIGNGKQGTIAFFDGVNSRFGIGTSSPSTLLHLSAANDPIITLTDTGFGASADITGSNGNLRLNSQTATIFDMADSEVARIDSSGNLLVNTTDTFPGFNDTNTGTSITSTGRIFASASGEFSQFNRNSSDGDILQFRKDGSEVGSIGNSGANIIYFAGAGSGVKILNPSSGFDGLMPSSTTGADRDASMDLGSANTRFKDLYLSGGAYLGGTGSANKLDDYEEGTWTPVYDGSTSASGVAYTSRSGSYTKIGNTVTASCNMVLSNKGTVVGVSRISGLPFAGNNSPAFHVIAPLFGNLDLDANQQGTGAQYATNSFVYLFITENDTGLVQMTNGHVNNNTDFHFTVTYMTNS